jgi:hypothetical protein
MTEVRKADMAKLLDSTKGMKAAFDTISIAVHVTAREIEKFYYGFTRPYPKKSAWSRSRSHPGV